MTIKDYYNLFFLWVCDVSLTSRVSWIWATMGLWATLDCVWAVVDPFIYGTETIRKSFFAVKWNQVFKNSVCCRHGLSCCFDLSEFSHGSSSSGWSLLSLYFKPTFQPISKLLTHSIISLLRQHPVTCLEKCMEACLLRLHTPRNFSLREQGTNKVPSFLLQAHSAPITCRSNLPFVRGSQSQWSWLKRERSFVWKKKTAWVILCLGNLALRDLEYDQYTNKDYFEQWMQRYSRIQENKEDKAEMSRIGPF